MVWVGSAVGLTQTPKEGGSSAALVLGPPHLVFKWAREVLETIPRARTFIIYDLRNGGDPTRPHGVVEVKQSHGQIVHKGLKTTLSDLRTLGRAEWKNLCPVPPYCTARRER